MSMSECSSELSPIIRSRFADDSGCSITGGFDTFGSACACVSRSCDDLARPDRVGPRFEGQDDRREARNRLGLDRLQPCDAVEEVRLQRNGDELLDILGRQAERLGLDLDVGGRDLGQRVNRGDRKRHRAEDDQPAGDTQDQQPESHAQRHDGSHQRCPSILIGRAHRGAARRRRGRSASARVGREGRATPAIARDLAQRARQLPVTAPKVSPLQRFRGDDRPGESSRAESGNARSTPARSDQ